MVIEIRGVENGELAVPGNNTLVRHTAFLATDTRPYVLITAQENPYKSQHETILADLNRYTTATRLVIILTDDAIKHACVWPLAWRNK